MGEAGLDFRQDFRMGRGDEAQHDRRAADSCGEHLIVGGELLDLRLDLGDL